HAGEARAIPAVRRLHVALGAGELGAEAAADVVQPVASHGLLAEGADLDRPATGRGRGGGARRRVAGRAGRRRRRGGRTAVQGGGQVFGRTVLGAARRRRRRHFGRQVARRRTGHI